MFNILDAELSEDNVDVQEGQNVVFIEVKIYANMNVMHTAEHAYLIVHYMYESISL